MSDKPKTIPELAKALGMSDKALNERRRMIRMEKPKDVERALERFLASVWREKRDEVRIPARQNGLTHPPQYATDITRAIDDPGEAPSADVVEEYGRVAWETFDVLKSEELARKQTRSRLERLRQAEIQLRKKGKPTDQYIAQIEEALNAMEREAKAA